MTLELPERAADLDHAATTRLRPDVLASMEPFLGARYGNPSGTHLLARDAVRAVDDARERIAGHLGADPGDVVFTSGGTEADNHAVSGGLPPRPGVPLCSAVEHHAVLDPVLALGGRVIDVDPCGRVDLDHLAALLDELGTEVSLVSVMAANNETGVRNDLAAVAAVVRSHEPEVPRTPVHTDAVQAAPWDDLAQVTGHADLVSLSAHKLGGPKGVGALVVRHGLPLAPLLLGGGQERDRRSGTANVAGIVGFAAALDLTNRDRVATCERIAALRDRLADGLRAAVPDLVETVRAQCTGSNAGAAGGPSDPLDVLPGFLHVCIPGVDSESILFLAETEGVYAAAASSCASGAQESSHVLAAIGVGSGLAAGALRLSLGWDSTDADVDLALSVLPDAIERIRSFGR